MKAYKHPLTNAVSVPPINWDHDKQPCDPLPVMQIDMDGVPAIISFWKPTPSELAGINAGHPVALWVMGGGMPPVALTVEPDPSVTSDANDFGGLPG